MVFFNGFSNLDSKTQEIIIGISLLIATLGPLLIVLGGIAIAIAGISAPVLATVLAVTALAAAIVFITDNWEALKERFSDISWWKNALIDMLIFLIEFNPFFAILEAYNVLREKLGQDPLDNPFDTLTDGLKKLKVKTKDYKIEFNDFGTSIKNTLKKLLPFIEKFNKSINLGSGKKETIKPIAIKERKDSLALPETLEGVKMPDDLIKKFKDLEKIQENIFNLNEEITTSFNSFGNTIEGVFSQALQSSDGFFKTFVEGSKQALKAILSQLAATVLLNALLGSTGAGALMGFKDIGGFAGIPKLFGMADGGLATGPSAVVVGEGPGTTMSNPEVIAPLDKLKSMIGESGGGNVQVFGTIKGSDILLSSDRAKNNRNRTRGY